MKKYIYTLIVLLAGVTFLSSCEKVEGTLPGNDTLPYAAVYTSAVTAPNDPDVDVAVRFAVNNATAELYYFAETQAKKEARNLPESEYPNYVIEHGQKITDFKVNESDGASIADVVIKNLEGGENVISAVAVNGDAKTISAGSFFSYTWSDVCVGEYYFANATVANLAGAKSVTCTLQKNDFDDTKYRLIGPFGTSAKLPINLLPDYTGKDGGENYIFARVPDTATGLNHPSYGSVGVRDIGYWQKNDAFITEGGYESEFFPDSYHMWLYVQYYVSAGNLGYNYDEFVPAN